MTVLSVRRGVVGLLLGVVLLFAPPPALSQPPSDAPPDSTLILTLRRSLNGSHWAEAESLSLVMRRRAESRAPLDTLLLARALDQQVAARIGAARIADAEVLKTARRALALRERALDPHHPDLAVSLIRLGELLNARGDCAAAIPLAERGVTIRETAYGPEANAVARGMMILGMGLFQCGRLEEARQVYEKSVVIREKALGPDASELAVSLNNLGNVLQNMGRLEEAQATLARALEIRRQTLPAEHPYIATTLGNLGNIALLRGRYAEARRLYLDALVLRETASGPRSEEAALSYVNLGITSFYTGDYDDAISWNERALDAREFSLGAEHPGVAETLDNYGGLLTRIGDYAEAIRRLERSIAIHRAATGDDPKNLCWGLMNLALAKSGAGQHNDAVRLGEESVRIMRRNREVPLFDRAQFEEGIAYIRMQKGDLLASRDNWRRALSLREADVGLHDPEVARVSAELADVERRLGHMVTADRLLKRALEIYRRAGSGLPGYPDARHKRSLLLYQKGDAAGALELALDVRPLDREVTRAVVRTMPERQALRFAATRGAGRDLILTLAAADTHAATTRAAWNDVMADRSFVLDEMAARLRLTHLAGNAEVDSIRGELSEAGAWLAHLLSMDERPEHPEQVSEEVARARTRYESAERALARVSLDDRNRIERVDPTLDALAAARPLHSAVVAFARYAAVPPRAGLPEPGEIRYLAFVLPADRSAPRVVPLGSAATIDARVAAWREELSHGALRRDRTEAEALAHCTAAGLELRRAVWDPLRAAVGGADRVFLVPDGPLHLINFGALPADDGGFLVERPTILHVVTTERDLLAPLPASRGRGLLAVGGAAFDSLGVSGRGREMSAASATPADPGNGGASAPIGFRGARNDCPRFRDLRFAPLAGSLAEITALTHAWSAAAPGRAGEPATPVSGRAASEETVKRNAAGQRVVHLATHGFYLDAACRDGAPSDESARGIGGLVPAAPEPPGRPRVDAPFPGPQAPDDLYPLHLSGVALAGANLRSEAGREREDGILTAEELAVLNLSGVEWVVLSACDSGVGAVGEGEGVFGLRRALQIAGARSVILALWSVRDDVTAPWMEALYAAHFGRGLDTATACREASLKTLAARRVAGASLHPFYWAGFLAAGDWR